MQFDKKTKRWNLVHDCERWHDCTSDTVRLLLRTAGLTDRQITTEMARAKCVAYGISISKEN